MTEPPVWLTLQRGTVSGISRLVPVPFWSSFWGRAHSLSLTLICSSLTCAAAYALENLPEGDTWLNTSALWGTHSHQQNIHQLSPEDPENVHTHVHTCRSAVLRPRTGGVLWCFLVTSLLPVLFLLSLIPLLLLVWTGFWFNSTALLETKNPLRNNVSIQFRATTTFTTIVN